MSEVRTTNIAIAELLITELMDSSNTMDMQPLDKRAICVSILMLLEHRDAVGMLTWTPRRHASSTKPSLP